MITGSLATGAAGFGGASAAVLGDFTGTSFGSGFESPQAASVINKRTGAYFMCFAAEAALASRVTDSEDRRDARHVDDVVALASA